MKKKLVCLFLMISGIMSAQIVNIPDLNFKNYLLSPHFTQTNQVIDVNNDGEIQLSEALAVEQMEFATPINVVSIQGIEAFSNLKKLYILSLVTNINLAGLTQLKDLTINGQNLTTLDLSGLNALEKLEIDDAEIATLDISHLTNLKFLALNILGSLNSLVIGNNINLNTVGIYSDSLSDIDLSNCPNINYLLLNLGIQNHDVYVNIKNGNINYTNPSMISPILNNASPYKIFVCIDENEYGNISIAPTALISTYCNFTPGGLYNTIIGKLRLDGDNNGCSSSDIEINNIPVWVNDNMQQGAIMTSTDGNYSFYTQADNFTIAPQFENPGLFTVTPPSATVSFTDNNNNTATQNFCITPVGVHPDLEIIIVPVDTARPGFDANYKIVYKNKGNQTLSGAVSFNYDDALLDYVTATPAYTTSAAGQLSWDYTNLLPFESRAIEVKLNLNGPMETPPVNNGDFLNYYAAITPVTGDETPGDNAFSFKQEVVGSYDPNDITCLEGEIVHPDNIGKYLHYNINFENTGTAPATFIVVKNVINAQQFDINTLQVLYASHNVETKVTGNKIEFIFNDINLAALDKGNVVFKIKTKPTVAVNATVSQKADIFFDYNWPIITNDANTTFTVLSRGNFKFDQSVKVYPNPASTIFTIEASSDIKSIQLYDIQGRQLQALSAEGQSRQIDVSALPSGIYFVKAATQNGTAVQKVVKE